MKRLFFGGIHPPYRKEISLTEDVCRQLTPERVVIPLLQHIGVAGKPMKRVGERVLMGEKIGDGDGLCVPVHASVSGRVVAIEERPHPSLRPVLSIVIENDFKNESIEKPQREWKEMNVDEILHSIREAGLVGMGGAAFPANVKALSAMGRVDTLIANGCECEPYITADDALMRLDPKSILEGMRVFRRLFQPKRTVLAVEDNKQEAVRCLKGAMEGEKDIEIAVLPTKYPQGSEKQLIQALTGRELPAGELPSDLGCAVFNVSSFSAIYHALRDGKPLIRRIVTVSGEGVRHPQNWIAPIGTPIWDLIAAAGGLLENAVRVIVGGPMMGIAQNDLSVPVVKATNSILCLPRISEGERKRSQCIRCGKCVQVCPMRLQPLYMYRCARTDDMVGVQKYNLMDCIECGCCAFICPACIELVDAFRKCKGRLREAKGK